jgi:hypothetical protein
MPLNNLFPTLQFDDTTHQYFDGGGGVYQSVTTWLNKFEPFDADLISKVQAKRRGVSQDVILLEWQEKADLGTKVHEIIENGLLCLHFNVFINEYIDLLTEIYKGLNNPEEIYFEQCFLHYPFGLCGMIDIITIKDGVCKVWDIKTTKDLTEKPRAKMPEPYEHIPKGKLSLARMQASMYAEMLKWNGNEISDEVGVIHIEPYEMELLNIYHLPRVEIVGI